MCAKPTIRFADLCQALEIGRRELSYLLEMGHLPPRMKDSPSTGNHRRFTGAQSFWVGVVVKLKDNGITTPLAAQIADDAFLLLGMMMQDPDWEPTFMPHEGQLHAQRDYFVEIADRSFIRLATSARSRQRELHFFDWHRLGKKPIKGQPVSISEPHVVVRVNLSTIARQIAAAFTASGDGRP